MTGNKLQRLHISSVCQAIITENVDELKRLTDTPNLISFNLGETFRGTTPLSLAIYRGHLPSFSVLLDSGAPFNKRSLDHFQRSETPIISAVRLGRKEMFLKLLNKGAKLNSTDFEGKTALFHAVVHQKISFVKLLLQKGAPITFTSGNVSPLNYVIQHINYKGRRDVAIELIAAGLDVNLSDHTKRKPLMYTIMCEDFSFFRLLIECGGSLLKFSEEEYSLPQKWKENSQIIQWFKAEINIPPPLMRLCRTFIRNHLRRTNDKDLRPIILSFQLPQLVLQYLLLQNVIYDMN